MKLYVLKTFIIMNGIHLCVSYCYKLSTSKMCKYKGVKSNNICLENCTSIGFFEYYDKNKKDEPGINGNPECVSECPIGS